MEQFFFQKSVDFTNKNNLGFVVNFLNENCLNKIIVFPLNAKHGLFMKTKTQEEGRKVQGKRIILMKYI